MIQWLWGRCLSSAVTWKACLIWLVLAVVNKSHYLLENKTMNKFRYTDSRNWNKWWILKFCWETGRCLFMSFISAQAQLMYNTVCVYSNSLYTKFSLWQCNESDSPTTNLVYVIHDWLHLLSCLLQYETIWSVTCTVVLYPGVWCYAYGSYMAPWSHISLFSNKLRMIYTWPPCALQNCIWSFLNLQLKLGVCI
jgi:hypothetical protein